MQHELTALEGRILGALVEKELATPEYYPLTRNGLVAACNQKNNRDPVMVLSTDEVEQGWRGSNTTRSWSGRIRAWARGW
jgi:uncharacterized protein